MSTDDPSHGRPKAPDPETPSNAGWSDRKHAALPAPRLAPKTAALQARRRRRMAARSGLQRTGHVGGHLTSADGTLDYLMQGAAGELYLERSLRRPPGSHVVQSMLFGSSAEFARWCDAEPLRFEDPVLHQRLQRQGHTFFDGVPATDPVPAADGPTLTDHMRDRAYAARVLGTVAQIASATDIPAAVGLLKRATRQLGADAAVFTSFVRDDATLASYRYLLACDTVWGLQYTANDWCRDDPWLRYALYNTHPIRADELPPLDAAGGWVVDGAAHFGFVSAVIVPVPSPAAQSRVGVLCLGSKRADYFQDKGYAQFRMLARGLAMELGDWMHRQQRDALMARARISNDELSLLRHHQQGHSSKVIAAALHTEPGTIDCRFHRLRLKLGAANRRDALRIAEIYGLI